MKGNEIFPVSPNNVGIDQNTLDIKLVVRLMQRRYSIFYSFDMELV